MNRDVLIACSPYLAAMLVATGLLWLLVRLSGARPRLSHARALHKNQQGGVQSLSFVLTLPLFVMILMFIVQLSQITIGTVVVEYAAFAAARAAMVWIPAEVYPQELANQIGVYRQSSAGSNDSNGNSYAVYKVDPTGLKYEKIQFTAAMACMPIAPSRQTQTTGNHPGMEGHASLVNAYLAMSPASSGNTQIATRLRRKLAYALNHTRVDIEVHHPLKVALGADAPLNPQPQGLARDMYPAEFMGNEFGWQDQLYVTVSHDFALLPGPGRLLARRADARPGTPPESAPGADRIARSLNKAGDVYVRTLTATVRLNNEGQKSSLPFYQTLRGTQSPNVAASAYSASSESNNGQNGGSGEGDGIGQGTAGGDANQAGASCCGNDTSAGEPGPRGDADNHDADNHDADNHDADKHNDNHQEAGGDQEGQHGDEGQRGDEGQHGDEGQREGEDQHGDEDQREGEDQHGDEDQREGKNQREGEAQAAEGANR